MTDKVMMLLSSDWFFPYWGVIGITIDDDKKRESLQHGCRTIVAQFMSRASEYWHISFDPGRVERTRTMFENLVRTASLPRNINDLILGLGHGHGDTEGTGTDSVMFALTERLRTVTAHADSVYLSAGIREIVEQVAVKYVTEVNWEQLCLRSATTWDRYLRRITPEQQTYLADILVSELLVESFQPFWREVTARLNVKQQEELMNWYRTSAKSIMGIDLPSHRVN